MAVDNFDEACNKVGVLGQNGDKVHSYFSFPKLEGELSIKISYRGKEVLPWNINNFFHLRKSSRSSKIRFSSYSRLGYALTNGRTNDEWKQGL